MKIINFEKNKMITLTNAEYESYLPDWEKCSNINTLMIKIMVKLKTIVIIQLRTEVLHICNLEYSVSKENPVVSDIQI